MAEVAGLVLGGVPLVLYAVDNYQEWFDRGRKYVRYGELLQDIKDDIFIQQEQLCLTFELLGLYEPDYKELGERLQALYPGKYTQFMRIIRRMEAAVVQLMSKLEIDAKGKVRLPKWTQEQIGRMGWEWRRFKRSIASKETKKLIDELQTRNDQLSNCLKRQEVSKGESSPMVQALQARFNLRDCDAVRQHAWDIKETLDSCWHCRCSGTHQTSLALDWHSNPPTKMPVFGVSMSYGKLSSGPSKTNDWQWRKVQVNIDEACKSGQDMKGKPVLGPRLLEVEINTVTSPPTGIRRLLSHRSQKLQPQTPTSPSSSISLATPSPKPAVGTLTEIGSLCQFLQDLDKNGNDLGFLLMPGDTKRVHITPVSKTHIPATEVLNLQSLLPPSKPPVHLSLNRRKRFEIAAAAAWATLLLYDTPWLNETWDKEGLYFFLEKNTMNDGLQAANPFVSRMLDKAKGAHRFQSKLIRNETIFALGILLIELCLNRSFDELCREENLGSGGTTILEEFEMANLLLDRVFLDAGDLYGDACRLCIRFEFPGRDITKNFSHDKFRQGFYNDVVAPLQATFAAIPQ